MRAKAASAHRDEDAEDAPGDITSVQGLEDLDRSLEVISEGEVLAERRPNRIVWLLFLVFCVGLGVAIERLHDTAEANNGPRLHSASVPLPHRCQIIISEVQSGRVERCLDLMSHPTHHLRACGEHLLLLERSRSYRGQQ